MRDEPKELIFDDEDVTVIIAPEFGDDLDGVEEIGEYLDVKKLDGTIHRAVVSYDDVNIHAKVAV